jgi:hypothetical protein
MGKHSNEGYQFNIVNGTVAGVYESEHGRLKAKHMDVDDIWSVQGDTVTKTEREHGQLEVTTYADADGDGIYAKVAKSRVADSSVAASRDRDHDHDRDRDHGHDDTEGYSFTISGNAGVAARESEHGGFEVESFEYGFVEITPHADSDGIYARLFRDEGWHDGPAHASIPDGAGAEFPVDLIGLATIYAAEFG